VYENVWPVIRLPESNTPVSDVAVCVVAPWLIQQTVPPGGTVTSIGLNAKSMMVT